MRWIECCVIAVLLTAAVVVTGSSAERTTSRHTTKLSGADSSAGGLIVHEWGTFTSFSGSDGIRLEFRPLADEDLPAFVLDRFLQSGVVDLFAKPKVRARLRMETPVTYFYTDQERDVNVRVQFPEGLLTEFYPPVATMAPRFKLGEKLSMTDSVLDWGRVHLIPTDRLKAHVDNPQLRQLLEARMVTGLIPPDDNSKNHYFHARETDSALVQIRRAASDDPKAPLAPAGDFFEKFLFYRGIGNLELPLQLQALGQGRYELTNNGPDAIKSLLLVTVDGDDVRFAEFAMVRVGGRLEMTQSLQSGTVEELGEAVAAALIGEGLYEKEAWAMVNTWKSSWFGEDGTRLLYMLPRRVTDEILPLQIEPRPDDTVRVLVGRMEILSPEDEARVVALIRQSAAERFRASQRDTTGKPPAHPLPAELEQLGRLAEPALARARAISDDPLVRSESTKLLRELAAAK